MTIPAFPTLHARRRFGSLVLACCTSGAAAQSSLMIWPLDPVIEDDQRASALWIENRSQQSASLQVRVLGWNQDARRDGYEAQDAVVPSPPMAVIPPGQRQLVRLMKTRPVPPGAVQAFRVLVDELPHRGSVNKEADGPQTAMGIKLQIRYSVPLFVSGPGHWTKPRADKPRDPAHAAQPELRWRTEHIEGQHFLLVRNSGTAHARLTAVQWARGGATAAINAGLLGYVLPGAEMRWPLDTSPPPDHVLQARVNAGDAPQRLTPQ